MTADEIIRQAKELPVVSETARKLTVQLNQPNLPRAELVETVRCDNVITAKLLRLCNSSAYGARPPIDSLDEALFIIGDKAVFQMVCTIGFASSLGPAPGYDTEANGLWMHSLHTATGAEYLAAHGVPGDFGASLAFTAGLLHDLGKVVISQVLTPKARAEIRQAIATRSMTRTQAEKLILGADHSEVGACLLRQWALPETIVEAAANHHAPVVKPKAQLSAVVFLANSIAHLCGSTKNDDGRIAQVNKTNAEVLGLEVDEIEDLIAGIQVAMQSSPALQAA